MWSAFYEFMTSAPVTAALAAVILAVGGAVGGQHPKIAALLTLLAGLFGRKTVKKPPVGLFLLALGALALSCSDASAGPIRDRLRARFGGPACPSCQTVSAAPVAAPACPCGLNCRCWAGAACSCGAYCSCPDCPAKRKATAAPAAAPACPDCAGGKCEAPAPPSRPGLFRRW